MGHSECAIVGRGDSSEEIKKAFKPYYEIALVYGETASDLLCEVMGMLPDFAVFMPRAVEAAARLLQVQGDVGQSYAALELARYRMTELPLSDDREFRGQLTDYVRLYSVLFQMLTFSDTDLEKLDVCARHRWQLLSADWDELPREV